MTVARGAVLAILTLLLLAGQAAAGQVTHHRFPSEALGRDYPYTLYLPAGYHDSGLDYPVIYLLHGSFGSERDWVNRGRLEAVADRMIRRGRIPPAVIVMPGSRSWWVDGHNEPARTAFLEELMPQVEALWRVVPEREWRGIAGLSAGGYGTVNMVLERPELFGAAAALSPASYYSLPPADSTARRHPAFLTPDRRFDAELWRRLNYPAHLAGYLTQARVVPLYLSAGDRDRFDAVGHARRLQAALEVHQPGRVPLEVLPGGHSWRVWRASLGPALDFMFRHLRPPIPARAAPSSLSSPPAMPAGGFAPSRRPSRRRTRGGHFPAPRVSRRAWRPPSSSRTSSENSGWPCRVRSMLAAAPR